MSTAWMIRNDGTAFPCVCHTYGNWDVEVVEETLAAAQWLYEHTAKSAVRELCMELIYVWAEQFQTAETDIVEIINQIIDRRPYRFLSKEFISAHAGELRAPVFVQTLESRNEDLNLELNQEFLRARYGGLYDTDPASREMFFRISSAAFDWYPIIRNFMEKANFPIESVTIVRDAEGAGGKNRPYRTLNGQRVYRELPLADFLAEADDPSVTGKGLVPQMTPSPGGVRGKILEGLSAGRALRELHDLPMNWERLKQYVRRRSWRELDLTVEDCLDGAL